MIKGTVKNFFELAQDEYGDRVVIGKKGLLEMYEYCKMAFRIEQVEKDVLDFNALALFQDFKNIEAQSDKITIYHVPQNFSMKIYYDYYHSGFQGNGDIYIFVDEENNIWSSNSELFSLYLQIQLGIKAKDIQEKNKTYLNYLNYFHCYDFILYQMK